MKLKLLVIITVGAALSGCANFDTGQLDYRKEIIKPDGTKISITKVRTDASSSTFFESKSSLAKWTAKQTESTQGAEVGGLSQETTASTNVVAALEQISKIIDKLSPK